MMASRWRHRQGRALLHLVTAPANDSHRLSFGWRLHGMKTNLRAESNKALTSGERHGNDMRRPCRTMQIDGYNRLLLDNDTSSSY
jgi:hypothetical protein